MDGAISGDAGLVCLRLAANITPPHVPDGLRWRGATMGCRYHTALPPLLGHGGLPALHLPPRTRLPGRGRAGPLGTALLPATLTWRPLSTAHLHSFRLPDTGAWLTHLRALPPHLRWILRTGVATFARHTTGSAPRQPQLLPRPLHLTHLHISCAGAAAAPLLQRGHTFLWAWTSIDAPISSTYFAKT